MREAEDALALDRAEDLALAALDDDELLVTGGAQAGVGGGECGLAQARPSPRRRSLPACSRRSACSMPSSPK